MTRRRYDDRDITVTWFDTRDRHPRPIRLRVKGVTLTLSREFALDLALGILDQVRGDVTLRRGRR